MSNFSFTAVSESLLKALSTALPAIPANPTVYIMSNFVFDLQGNTLTITGGDLYTEVVTPFLVQSGKGSGKICVPAKIIVDTLKVTPGELVFKADLEKFHLEIKTKTATLKISCEEADNYPTMNKQLGGEPKHAFSIDKAIFESMLAKTAYCVSKDPMRPAMTAVNVECDKAGITFVATSGYSVTTALYKGSEQFADGEGFSFLCTPKPMQLIKPFDAEKIEVSIYGEKVMFRAGDARVTARLIDEHFPDWKSIMPKEENTELTFDRATLIESLRCTAGYSGAEDLVLLKANDQIMLSAKGIGKAVEALQYVPCEREGNRVFAIGFNRKYMYDNLNAMSGESVKIAFDGPKIVLIDDNKDQTIHHKTIQMKMNTLEEV